MKKVGIFAGTFDPIHEGHISFAKEALGKLKLDKVFFLVEPNPRRKQGVKALNHRVNMVQLAIEREPHFGSIILEHPRFSVVETLPILNERFKSAQLHLLLGEDIVAGLNEWPGVKNLIQQVHFAIGIRTKKSKAEEIIKSIEATKGMTFKYQIFKTSLSNINSSLLRRALKHGIDPIGINEDVLLYIKFNGLYSPREK